MKIFSIPTGNLKLDGGAMFGVVPKALWQKVYPADENNLCNWAMRCLLIEEDNRRILIDTGIGDKQGEKFSYLYQLNGEDSLLGALNKYNFSCDDITDVIFTHLHFDHVGGAVRYNKDKTHPELTFKNADYWISRLQWDTAINPNRKEKASFLKENILPIGESSRLKLIDDDIQLFPNVHIKLYNGHTAGQIIPYINYKEKTIVFMGDLIASTAHIPLHYVMSYDVRPLEVMVEKEQFLNDAVQNGYILFLEHDIFNECCTVQNTEKGIRADKTFYLHEYFTS